MDSLNEGPGPRLGRPVTPGAPCLRCLQYVLLALVTLRMGAHVFFVPPFEGPDEPFHLDRTRAVADNRSILSLSPDVVAAVRATPCSSDLSRAFGCPLFQPGGGMAGSLWRMRYSHPSGAPVTDMPNYERQQPPLYYSLAGMLLRAAPGSALPFRDLLVLRGLSFGLVIAALVILAAVPAHRTARCMGLALLLLPGAAEGLIRASNDAIVFLWASVTCVALARRWHSSVFLLLCAVGPFFKLTALSITAVVALYLWRHRGALVGLLAAIAAFTVLVARFLLAWSGGVTYSLAGTLALHETVPAFLYGAAKTLYGLGKTSLWLGGWVGFRPGPVALGLAVLSVLVPIATLRSRDWSEWLPHLGGLVVAAAGVLFVGLGNRAVFGVWGGIGGWYVWNWAPWLWLASIRLGDGWDWAGSRAVIAVTLLVLVVNVLWWKAALLAYN